MKKGLPSYIIAQDIKGGYNNVKQEKLIQMLEEQIVPQLDPT